MKLKNGRVTQNGCWVSYKTTYYHTGIGLILEMAKELKGFLDSKGIPSNIDDYEVHKATISNHRLGCVSICAFFQRGEIPAEVLDSIPFEDNFAN